VTFSTAFAQMCTWDSRRTGGGGANLPGIGFISGFFLLIYLSLSSSFILVSPSYPHYPALSSAPLFKSLFRPSFDPLSRCDELPLLATLISPSLSIAPPIPVISLQALPSFPLTISYSFISVDLYTVLIFRRVVC